MTTWSIITKVGIQEFQNLKVKPGKHEGVLGQSFEVRKTTMLLLKYGGKIQNSAKAHVSYAYFDGIDDLGKWTAHNPHLFELLLQQKMIGNELIS